MRSPFHTPFVAIFQNEVLLNSKRIAPYALMILFTAYAVLLWGWGPAVRLGWATNSDFYIARNLLGFSFLGLPIFNAVIMGDAVIRDFRLGIDALIFSQPVGSAQYLLGKFFGNFFVLVCCQGAFALTLLVLQAFRTSQMIVQPVRVFPYFKHFFFFVVITHLVLAAVYFIVGTLTRNPRIVYGLAVCFYPLYISYGLVLLRGLPLRWRALLDPMLLSSGLRGNGFLHSADFLNRFAVSYTVDMIANRVLVILFTTACLAILYVRFTISERSGNVEKSSMLNLSMAAERVYYDLDSFQERRGNQFEKHDSAEKVMLRGIPLPEVTTASDGILANLRRLVAATGLELSLLRAERSLVVIIPLAVLLSFLSLPFSADVSSVSYSASFASHTANGILLFLLGVIVFYTGEVMHRDREVRIQPLVWAAPVANNVILLSKFMATFLLTLSLVIMVGLTAIATQFLRGHTPVEIPAYLITYSVILLPSIIVMTGVSVGLNVLLRDKYLTYAFSIATASGLFYLYANGHNHWLYNPLLYGLWNYQDLTNRGTNHSLIFIHRIYCISIAILSLSLVHLLFPRKSTRAASIIGHFRSSGWSLIAAIVSLAATTIAAVTIVWRVH